MNLIHQLAKAVWAIPLEFPRKIQGFSRVTLGQVHIWIPGQFTCDVKAAIQRIESSTLPFFSKFKASPVLILYSSRNQMYNNWLGIFSISDNYLAWHSEGIAAFLAHARFQFGADRPLLKGYECAA